MASADLSAAVGVDLTSFTRRYADAWNECDLSAMAERATVALQRLQARLRRR